MVGMSMNGTSIVKNNLTISSIVDNMLLLHHGILSVSSSLTNMDLIASRYMVFHCSIVCYSKKISNKLNIQQKRNLLKMLGRDFYFLLLGCLGNLNHCQKMKTKV